MEPALTHMIDRILAASAAQQPLCIRGGGSKDFYGNALHGEWLDTRDHAGIVNYEPSELVVTARAGTSLLELEAVLAEKGQYLPFEPPHFSTEIGDAATVGGMVASGLGGPARAAVGNVRDYVLGVQIINGRGELLTFGGQVMKNVAGYDVSRLMAGSMGTLGVIAEVSLKVLPLPVAEATLLFHVDEATAIRQLNVWAGKPLPVNASCWVNDRSGGGDNPSLYVRLRGARAAVEAACQTMGGERKEAAAVAADWTALREQTLPFFARADEECLWRLSVPDTTAPLRLADTLIEWGGAQRWVKAPVRQREAIRAAADAAGGHATLFVADSAANTRAEGVFGSIKMPLDRIHRELKRQFDPANIFNRGRLYAN